jgi:hypothetical protein
VRIGGRRPREGTPETVAARRPLTPGHPQGTTSVAHRIQLLTKATRGQSHFNWASHYSQRQLTRTAKDLERWPMPHRPRRLWATPSYVPWPLRFSSGHTCSFVASVIDLGKCQLQAQDGRPVLAKARRARAYRQHRVRSPRRVSRYHWALWCRQDHACRHSLAAQITWRTYWRGGSLASCRTARRPRPV